MVKKMQQNDKRNKHGGARPGAGRPKGAHTITKQVTMRAEVWEKVNAVILERGTTRMEFFEAAVLAEIGKKIKCPFFNQLLATNTTN